MSFRGKHNCIEIFLRCPAYKGFLLFLLTWGVACSSPRAESAAKSGTRPNIIYILADDLGYGDLGAYGQQHIETPNLDALAGSGMLFTQHYASAPVCAPSRYMFLTGKHSGHAYIRGNDEWRDRGEVWDYRAMALDSTLEGQRPMPEGEVLLSHRLQEAGYRTGLFGKWGLGAPHTHSVPNKRGFDTFFGYNCQRQAHTYTPLFLYKDTVRVFLENDTIPPHSGFELTGGEEDYEFFQRGEYAPDRIFEALDAFVSKEVGKPFFAVWATPIPHVALQAPEKWVQYYHQKFGEEAPYDLSDGGGYFPNRYPRATYAAMVSYLDERVGQLIAKLKALGEYENTLIFFTSDNGPSYAGGADPVWFQSAGPFASGYGRGKGFVYEGGIRVPMIASWPGNIEAGSKTNVASIQYDMMATLGELVGFEPPTDNDGRSFLPVLTGQKTEYPDRPLIWAFPEYGGQMALRMGDWKLVHRGLNDTRPDLPPELYNLGADPTESRDLAAEEPHILDSLQTLFKKEYEIPEIARFRLTAFEANLIPKE